MAGKSLLASDTPTFTVARGSSPEPSTNRTTPARHEPALRDGTVIEGRYRIDGALGAGGMSTVYESTDLVTKRVLVLKTLKHEFTRPELGQLLQSEFRTMAALHHPNLAEVHDFVITGAGSHFFTMERVDGVDLRSATEGRSWQEIVGLVVQVCRALAYIHSRGLIHFDVKPANVLVDRQGVVKLLDFGVAAVKNELEGSTLRGTPVFMAPELFSGRIQEIDQRVDLYSLGMTLFDLLCRRSPVDERSIDRIMQKVLAGEAARFRPDEAERLPAWLCALVQRLVSIDASDRPPTAGAVVAAINEHMRPAFEFETEETRSSYVLSSRFVGRASELARVRGFVDGRLDGAERGSLLVVSGPGGSGKSRLLREVQHHAQSARLPFVTGDCHELSGPELGPVAQVVALLEGVSEAVDARELVARYGPELVKLDPGFGRGAVQASEALADPSAELFRIQQAAIGFVLALAQHTPLAIYFNDLQWAPASTARFVEDLAATLAERARRGQATPIALLGSARPDDGASSPFSVALGRLRRDGRLVQVELPPLDQARLGAMMRSMLGVGELPEAFVACVAAEAGGNPFFVEEVMRTLVESGAIGQQGGVWTADALSSVEIPTTMREVVGRRVQLLDDAQRLLLRLLSLVDRSTTRDELAACAALDPGAFTGAVHELLRRRMILKDGRLAGGLRVAHDRIREQVIAGLDDAERGRLHARVAEALERLHGLDGEAIVRIAQHYERAGAAAATTAEHRRRVRTLAARKSRQEASFQVAEGFVSLALESLGERAFETHRDDWLALANQLMELRFINGRVAEAGEVFEAIRPHLRGPEEIVRAYQTRVMGITHGGDHVAALDAGIEGLRLLGIDAPRKVGMPQVLGQMVRTRLAMRGRSDRDLGEIPATQAPATLAALDMIAASLEPAITTDANCLGYYALLGLRLSLAEGRSAKFPVFVAMFGMLLAHGLGDFREAERFCDLGLALAKREPQPEVLGFVSLIRFFVAPWVGDPRRAVDVERAHADEGAALGDVLFAALSRGVSITLLSVCSQDLEEQWALLGNYQSFLMRVGDAHSVYEIQSLERSLRCLQGEADEGAEGEAEFARRLEAHIDPIPFSYYRSCRVKTLVLLERWDEALEVLRRYPQPIVSAGQLWELDLMLFAALAHARAPGGSRPRAQLMLWQLERRAQQRARGGPRWFDLYATFAAAERARLLGLRGVARQGFERARRVADLIGHGLLAACAVLYDAQLDDPIDAALLRDARSRFEAYGARAVVQRLPPGL